MVTVVNNPGNENPNNGMGMIVGVIIVLALVLLFFVYGLPMLRQSASPQINVPNKVDVNLHNSK